MASTDNSTYSQVAAQQGHSAYTTQPTQNMHRQYRHMGSNVMEPLDSPRMSTLTRLRPLRPMGGLCNFLWTASCWLYYSKI